MSLTPEGEYPARVVKDENGKSMQFGLAGEKNTRQVAVRVQIGGDTEFKGRVRTYIGFLTDAAIDRTLESLRTMGAQGDDLSKWPDQDLDEDFKVVIKHEDDLEGKPRERIAFINRVGGGTFTMKKQLSADDLIAFAAQMRGKAAKHPAVTKKAPAATTNGTTKPAVDVDL
jgi:hypothetical protein